MSDVYGMLYYFSGMEIDDAIEKSVDKYLHRTGRHPTCVFIHKDHVTKQNPIPLHRVTWLFRNLVLVSEEGNENPISLSNVQSKDENGDHLSDTKTGLSGTV